MTDEELGRKWAAKNGIAPLPRHMSGGYSPPSWSYKWAGSLSGLPAEVLEAVRQVGGHWAETPGGMHSHLSYETEEEAYAALGMAIRKVQEGQS